MHDSASRELAGDWDDEHTPANMEETIIMTRITRSDADTHAPFSRDDAFTQSTSTSDQAFFNENQETTIRDTQSIEQDAQLQGDLNFRNPIQRVRHSSLIFY